MNLRKSREEIPIWWRSDSSSKGKKSESKSKNDRSETINGQSESYHRAKTLKRWFPETEVATSSNHRRKDKNESNSKKKVDKRSKEKAQPTKSLAKNHSESSIPSSRLSFVIPDDYNHSNSHETQSLCNSLINSSSSYTSESSSSLTYSNFSSLPSSIFSSTILTDVNDSSSLKSSNCSSSCCSSSCSSCCSSSSSSCSSSSSSYTSTLYAGSSTLSNSSSSIPPKKDTNIRNNPSKSKKGHGSHSGIDIVRTIDSIKRNTLTVQKLPTVSDIPLNPYCLHETLNTTEPQKTTMSRRNRIVDEINKFEGWGNLEKAFSAQGGASSMNKEVIYSLSIFYIDVITKETIVNKDIELGNIVPRITLSINSGSKSEKRIQHSETVFSEQGHKIRWGDSNTVTHHQKDLEKIDFSLPIYQVEDYCNYFSLAVEGVSMSNLKTNNILGTAFCPLPKKNDKWNISIPIYSCFQVETFMESKDPQLVSNISSNTFKKLGKISFILSRREPKDGTDDQNLPIDVPKEPSPKLENEITREIRSQILSCLSNMNLMGENMKIPNIVKKSVVAGEVAYSIFSDTSKEQSVKNKEKELELKEREIRIREKELELQIKRLATQHTGESVEANDVNGVSSESTKFDHSYDEKRLKYFRIKNKSNQMCRKIKLARQKKNGTLSLGLRRSHESPRLIISKESGCRDSSKGHCKHKKQKSEEKKRKEKNKSESGQDIKEQNVYHPVQIPLLVNNLPISPPVYTGTIPQNYALYCPSVPGTNKENSLVQAQSQVQVPQVSLESLKNLNLNSPEIADIPSNTRRHLREAPLHNSEIAYHHKNWSSIPNINSITHSGPLLFGNQKIKNSNHGGDKFPAVNNVDQREEVEIDKFLKNQFEVISINGGSILNESRSCSNSLCKYSNNRIEYSKCEFTDTEIDNWKICQYCQMEMFPSLYFIKANQPKFIEFFFDSSIPIFFPSRQLIWPTSLHFLLAQFFSNFSEVRECSTHDQILGLVKKRRNSIDHDILPNIAVIVLAIKVFQHSVLQQLLLTFSEREFFLLKEYWIKHDPLIRLVSTDSRSALSNLGENLITTLEKLKIQIQRWQCVQC
ncbi:hypothetical protein OJ252_3448 [Cryptosporidium canis]|uniref:C2 NT-type domain-containing protein n=1 Tax=Cryptosporidium canis TaxID=195482 RepID=A0ABQ8P2A6_9CRYT|nr:hypothetical protein OJ252_3448 [Cryptosporidium canis]